MREWIDDATGRTVRQLTEDSGGVMVDYFRVPRRLPDGRFLARQMATRNLLLLDLNSGAAEVLSVRGRLLELREADGHCWFTQPRQNNFLWEADLPHGEPRAVAEMPEGWSRRELSVTCDGAHVVSILTDVDGSRKYSLPTTKDPACFWEWCDRPRRGYLEVFDVSTGNVHRILETEGVMPTHIDSSPTDPGFLKFAYDGYDGHCQRVWGVNIDGSGLRKIREQERGEMVTHEFWWPDGQLIGFKYQDRRHDSTVYELPWSEYSPIATQFGLSNLEGEQVYLSDPINHYHTHINVSADGSRLCGEGTDGHNFVYAAQFSRESKHIDFVAQASIHTRYTPFRGQNVDSSFSHDGEWVIYNDTIEGAMQVCAVKVSFEPA